MKPDIIRIALIGPESSGKTTLCMQLAEYFKTVWVPEYARDYIGKLNVSYTKEDIIHCAEMQMKIEEESLLKANKILFSDTELIVCNVWLQDVFHLCPIWIEKKIQETKYDLYLLTKPDLPFIDDPVRENPHRRDFFYNWYKAELEKRKFNFEIIEGFWEERLMMAMEFVKKCLNLD